MQIIIAILVIGSLLWVANWPFLSPDVEYLDDAQRKVEKEHNRRHHRAVIRASLIILALGFGILAAVWIPGSPTDRDDGFIMATLSLACIGAYSVIVRYAKRR